MRTETEILKDIENQKQSIEFEKKFNKDSDELSFLYWQLSELEKELENERSNKRV